MDDDTNRTSIPATDVEQDIRNEPLAAEKAPGLDSRVNIRVTSFRRFKHDPEGISIKACLDGIVRAGILPDDSTSEINEVTFKSIIIKKDEKEKTIIEIE